MTAALAPPIASCAARRAARPTPVAAAFGAGAFLLLSAPRAAVALPAAERPIAAADEAELARAPRLATVLRLGLERNRDLAEVRARAVAAQARLDAAARLPDAELKYEQWGVPLARPLALGRADTVMLGVRQGFPAWGSLEARGRAAAEEAAAIEDNERARRQEVAAQIRRSYATYYKASEELRLHLEHVGLTSRVLELVRLGQRTGGAGGLASVLRLELELTRLHTDLARLEREQRSSRALLNALMDRSLDAPLGPPEEPTLPARAAGAAGATGGSNATTTPPVAALEAEVDARRPEIAAGARAVRRSEAELEDRRRSARLPTVTVGVDYWYMPLNTDTHHGYGAMIGVNLPWLSGRRRAEQREAEATVRAERQALESTRNAVRYQLRDAAARFDSARQSFLIVDEELLARARRSLEAAQAAYAAGQGDTVALLDALRSYLQVRIERVRALAELSASEADLERAAGTLAVTGGAP